MFTNELTHEGAGAIALSVEKACELSCIGRTKFYELIKSKKIPARKVGRRTIILLDELYRALKRLPVVGR